MTSLLGQLRTVIGGEVLDDVGTRGIYATDASNHRVVPLGVAYPRDTADVVAIVKACAGAGVAVTSRGAGTNCAGNAIGPGIVIDHSRHLASVLTLDAEARTATVQPGLVLDRLQASAAPHGLLFGVDPSSHSRCTIGGMVGTNACGSHSVAWGTTAANVVSLDVVLADGSTVTLGPDAPSSDRLTVLGARLERVRDAYLGDIRTDLGRFNRQISGYGLQYLLAEQQTDLAKAFVGSEGTCGVVSSATVRLVEKPSLRSLVVAGFPDEVAAAGAAPSIAALQVLTVEGLDDEVVRTSDLRLGATRRPRLPRGRAWLLVEVGGPDVDSVRARSADVMRAATDAGALATTTLDDVVEQRACWAIRERGAGLASRSVDGAEFLPGWEDAAVPPERLGDYLREFRALMAGHGRQGMVYGHFGEGCVHVRIDHQLSSERGRADYRSFQEDAADLVVAHGGSLSGEHGDGRARSELLGRMYGDRVIEAFRAFKHAFDPNGLLNPGVLVDPDPLDENLRATHSVPYQKNLGFLYPHDDGDLSKALRRCTGVGACRKTTGGGMCPSFRATSDETHSTRGRARVLAELLDGEVVPDGWQSDVVNDALDLCLSCKACSSECPVGVDMATYKAEFLHQRYRRRVRPKSHYSMGMLPVLLALGRRAPTLGNRLLGVRAVQDAAKRLGGIDQRRELPRLAERSFMQWYRAHVGPPSGDPVVLWVDTFTKSFAPEIARAAVLVLERAGYRVELAAPTVCCGLTWVSTGQLDIARKVMGRSLRLLDRAAAESPIVALEPSCATALRHDAANLVGGSQAARVSGRIRSLAEVVVDRDLPMAGRSTEAVAQFHCHQRATFGTAADRAVLESAGVAVSSVDDGCCGLAGNFGFEDGHYDISVACAEEALLPALRTHPEDQPVLADGYSCRLQIQQLGGRRALHLAELLQQLAEPTNGRR
ncbi:MAG: FAD-binding and (Fe-S)-binding domain-containing protein [Nocardioidaceae bacterium]